MLLGHWTSSAFFDVTFLGDFLVVPFFCLFSSVHFWRGIMTVCIVASTCLATSSRLIADYSSLLFMLWWDESGD